MPSNTELFLLINSEKERLIAKCDFILSLCGLKVIIEFPDELMFEMKVHFPVSIKGSVILMLDESVKLFGKHSDNGSDFFI